MRLAPLCTTMMVLALTSVARADTFDLVSTRVGNIQYVFVGAALADNTNLANGVNCLLSSAQVTVNPNMLSANPKLVEATLYVSGSLIGDRLDYAVNNLALFDPNATGGQLAPAAEAAAAVMVNFQPPGAATPSTVSLTSGVPYVSVYAITAGPETGNVGFFISPIDVTRVINNAGGGQLAGTYTVSSIASASNPVAGQVLSDVCNGLEAVCDPNNASMNCASMSAVHDNGTASFALLLVYEDLALPLYSISLYEGMYALFSQTLNLPLVSGLALSDPAVGSLTYYVIEGDLTVGRASTGTCGGDEYVQVNGGAGNLCLNDADNPNGNIYNGTLNFEHSATPPYAGCPNFLYCCGPDVCGLAGVDIDTYDISPSLAPGSTQINVTLATGSDRIALASLVVGAQVFEALLVTDTQFRTLGTVTNAAQVGNTVIYSLAISNTGNLAAEGVQVSFDAPAGVTGFDVLLYPAGATPTISPTGGVNSTGTASFSGFNVEPGQIQEIRFAVTTQCVQLGQTLDVSAMVTGTNVPAFTVAAPALTVGGPGVGACVGLDPTGPFSGIDPVHNLRGGGGGSTCTQGAEPLWLVALILAAVATARRRYRLAATASASRRYPKQRPQGFLCALCVLCGSIHLLRRGGSAFALALGLAASTGACGKQHPGGGVPPPQALTSTNDLPGTPCSSETLMVQVTPANGNAFCIDRFEAGVDSGALGNAVQSANDTTTNTDGSTQAKAGVALGVAPATNISWWQAQAACANAGKRLCTVAEWEFSCRGPSALTYPYGNTVNETACNGFFDFNPTNPADTGSFKLCVSAAGAYDLSGNVAEWLATPVSRTPDSNILNDRATHGGSYASNDSALACVGVQFHSAPGTQDPTIGFRCCMDAP